MWRQKPPKSIFQGLKVYPTWRQNSHLALHLMCLLLSWIKIHSECVSQATSFFTLYRACFAKKSSVSVLKGARSAHCLENRFLTPTNYSQIAPTDIKRTYSQVNKFMCVVFELLTSYKYTTTNTHVGRNKRISSQMCLAFVMVHSFYLWVWVGLNLRVPSWDVLVCTLK